MTVRVSSYRVAHSRALGPGITERVPERPGKARKACFRRKFDGGLRQELPLVGKTRGAAADTRSCRAGQTRRGLQNWTKSSLLESSRRALQVALNRRIQIDAARAVRAREESGATRQLPESSPRDECRCGGCGGVSKDRRRTAATSPRPTELALGARGIRKKDTRR
ncbi:hypothetical protein THAOC_24133 [Thalassiosira oceanica]|uniref:Uncharacterized protein n=1 Tax=Thalassiosira oceanica TaxID=159749 RepID=K0RSQ8_THAOC|nr:hypothetical protein THAOC_24133 [Thalassiosira oceanica]|eukprot:EJK56050.1 hypothetical protein THAOC_24133 [Thalassiosira oceanica]